MENSERDEPPLSASAGVPAGLGLREALPLLFSAARTGRLWAEGGAAGLLEVWLEQGRVLDAMWGPLRALTALEMAALLPPGGDVRFEDRQRAPTRTLDLSAIDVAARLAEVSRTGGKLAAAIPGIDAIPRQTGHRPRSTDYDAARLLEQIDGTRSVADLTVGRQPLAVVRALAGLVEQDAVTFDVPAAPLLEPAPAAPPDREPAPVAEFAPGVSAPGQARPRRFQVNVALAALALAVAVGLWVAIQRSQTDTSGVTITVTAVVPPTQAQATAVPAVAAAQPTQPQATAVPAIAAAQPTQPQATVAPTAAPTVPAAQPTQPQATVAPTVAAAQPTQPQATVAPTVAAAQPTPGALLDEAFATGAGGWPSAVTSSAFWDSTGYHLVPRNAGQYVAITAPNSPALGDGTVTALFRKLAGPVGGGYGVILRSNGALDGSTQGGRFYVFEVGDRGEIGAWRREQNQWIELKPWTASEAVHAGVAENSLQVRAAGSHFTFSVNGTTVADVDDATLPSGSVGVFTGGDGNQVQLERFTLAP